MRTTAILALFVVAGLCACSARDRAGVYAGAQYVGAPTDVPGYQHTINVSKFVVGSNAQHVDELGMTKIVGSDGTFATDPMTHAVVALPNGGARALSVPAVSDPKAHNSQVIAYFEACGLPADQVGGAHVLTEMAGGGPVGQPAPPPTFVGYNSVVERTISGIRVEDSFAWARFNQSGDVVMESVYWPPISADVVTQAIAFQAKLADASTRDKFLAGLPTGRRTDGMLAVHHTGAFAHVPFSARVSFDVVYGGAQGRRHMRRFDINGLELAELPTGVPRLTDTPKPLQH